MKYSDLAKACHPAMTCTNGECHDFHELFSATRGDYFMYGDDEDVVCVICQEPMHLAREVTAIVIEGEEL